MTRHFLFAQPVFTAREVAKEIGKALDRTLTFQEADELNDADASVDVTNRVHVQVGTDYLVVCAWVDEVTLQSWPPHPNIPYALRDLKAALQRFPEPRP